MTFQDGQKSVNVKIYQGEDPDALNNIEIGEFTVEDLQDVPAGNIITLTLALDLNGMLHVSAREKATGLEKSITINNAISRFETEELAGAKRRIDSLFGQMDSGSDEIEKSDAVSESKAVAEARQLIKKAETLFDTVSDEDKEDMVNLIETITDCIEAGDEGALQEPVEQLNDIIYYLES